MRSLSRFSQTCHRGRAVVGSLPAYKDLVRHASLALTALSGTKLIALHSAASLHTVLQSENCTTCQLFGPFLFLPTAERHCYECLLREKSFRLLNFGTTRQCFGLTRKDLLRIPTIVTIPEPRSDWARNRRSNDLFSLKQAKELGVAKHGSQEAMERYVAVQNSWQILIFTSNELERFQWVTRPFSEYTELPSLIQNDIFCGKASILFPVLRANNVVEDGIWCAGCRSRSPPVGGARSKSSFIEHVKVCKGAEDVFKENCLFRVE